MHSDVGGGYPAGEWGLSDIALAWLRDKAVECGLKMEGIVDSNYKAQPNPLGQIHDSKSGLYRLTPGIDRMVGTKVDQKGDPILDKSGQPALDPTQEIHPSVFERWDQNDKYRPKNLQEFFKRIGEARQNG